MSVSKKKNTYAKKQTGFCGQTMFLVSSRLVTLTPSSRVLVLIRLCFRNVRTTPSLSIIFCTRINQTKYPKYLSASNSKNHPPTPLSLHHCWRVVLQTLVETIYYSILYLAKHLALHAYSPSTTNTNSFTSCLITTTKDCLLSIASLTSFSSKQYFESSFEDSMV